MSATKRPAAPAQRPLNSPSNASSRSPTPSASAPNGVQRTRSARGVGRGASSTRPTGKRQPGSSLNLGTEINTSNPPSDHEEEDARAETAALIEDLKAQVRRAETVSENYLRQLNTLQARLDEAQHEQSKLEDRLHENDGRIQGLETTRREMAREKKEMEQIYEAERLSLTQDRDEMVERESGLHSTIQRLKDALRESRANGDADRQPRSSNDSSDDDEAHFAPPSVPQRSDSRNNSKLVLQKDRLIESLRLELAEAQIKMVESENLGGGHLQELEKTLLETRMTNARLMEDNESFQLLLSEKTLNGDFAKADLMQGPQTSIGGFDSPSLADELESAAEGESDNYRKLEVECRSMKDQNKALTLYINNIISRVLQHDNFEAILDKSADPRNQLKGNTNKDLPPPPPPEASGQSILQRAKSVAISGNRPRPRPVSSMPPPTNPQPTSSTTENPSTAPSIPLARSQSMRTSGRGAGHRRANSDWTHPAATVVGQMYRGPPSGSSTSPAISPGSGALATPRQSFFAPPPHGGNPNSAARVPPSTSGSSSGSRGGGEKERERERGDRDSVSTVASDYTGEVDTPSPPRTSTATGGPTSSSASSTAPIAGNKLRPLRLVQENVDPNSVAEQEAAAKKAKRGSWMGWFNMGKGGPEGQGPGPAAMGGEVVKE
ncbi:MAG: hypothetical protein M1817_000958 [Caeruleum heppii]|nr:MAG: hypothetical protein M1817_000958 [Caeruleum heppii]